MACRSCRRQLLLQARRVNTPVTAEPYNAALGLQQLGQRATTTPITATPVAYAHRRGFRSTPTQSGIRDVIRSTLRRSAEPYRVVAATKEIYDACSKAAPYKIDPIAIKAGTIPKTPDGEDLGEGGGMWHDGMHSEPVITGMDTEAHARLTSIPPQISNSRPPSAHGPRSPCCTCTSSSHGYGTSIETPHDHGKHSSSTTSSSTPRSGWTWATAYPPGGCGAGT